MNKQEFIDRCTANDQNNKRKFSSGKFVVMPCNCGVDVCKGWAVVRNDRTSMHMHVDKVLMKKGHESRMPWDEIYNAEAWTDDVPLKIPECIRKEYGR